jgi:opacity protein-like surface antigen
MKPRHASSFFAAACVAAASAAHALPMSDNTNRTSFELFAGGDLSTPGAFRGPVHIEGSDGTSNLKRLDFSDAYQHDYTVGAELDFNLDPHLSLFAQAAFSQYNGQNSELGFLASPAQGFVPIHARFSDENTGELDLGARYTFAMGEKVRPFVGASLGAEHVSNTYATVDNVRVGLSKSGTLFQQRLETGLQFSPMQNFDVRLTAAANHIDGGKSMDDPNLPLLGLDGSNSAMHAHWDYPAEIGAVWHF